MVGQHLHLVGGAVAGELLDRVADPLVEPAPLGGQHGVVGDLLHDRVREAVGRLARQRVLGDQLLVAQRRQSVVELVPSPVTSARVR